MEHAEARELLEIAAIEPGGLDRLAAGDTPESAQLAGHLVGCEECARELGRLRRTERLLRATVATMPPPELKTRTLAFVEALGRDRSAGGLPLGRPAPSPVETSTPFANLHPIGSVTRLHEAPDASGEARPAKLADVPRGFPARRRWAVGWVGSLAAAIVIAIVGTATVVNGARNADVLQAQQSATELASVNISSLQLLAAPDVQKVQLASANGQAQGSLIFASSTGRVVVTATGLAKPAGTGFYRCWVQQNGQTRVLGWMRVESGIAYWVGQASGLSSLSRGAMFGVSLVPSPESQGQLVLQGTL